MNDRNNPPSFSNKVVDLKPRGADRSAHSPFGQFTPDEELLQSTARIKAQRDVILDRLEKMRSSQARVSKSVYDKVRRDYTLQLETVTELLSEKKYLLKEEIKKLYTNREKLSFEINRHKEILEEAEFRHFLSEFTETQYQEVENFETREVEKLEVDLSHISQWIRTHEELFDPEDFGITPQTKSIPAKTPDDATQTAVAPTPPKKTEPTVVTPVQPVTVQKSPPPPEENVPAAASTETQSDAASLDDFSYLFHDTPEENVTTSFGSTETNIKELLEAKWDEAVKTAEPTETPVEEELLIPEPKEESVIPQPTHNTNIAEEESVTSPPSLQRQTLTPDKARPVVAEDSISHILDSIRLEGEDDANAPVANAPVAANVIKTAFKLIMIQGDLDQDIFAVNDNTSIGRSPSNDVVLKEPKVSRQHAAINKYNENYILIDLKSSNGVYVNGTKIDECVLHSGDEISIGGYKFVFQAN